MTIPVEWAVPQIISFMLVVARLSGLFLLAPVFSSNLIPVKIKIMALLGLAATMTPIVVVSPSEVPVDAVALTILIIKESLIGLALGFAVSVVFSAVQVGAMLIDTSIGFSLANIIDPLSNTHASLLGSFYTLVATLSFLAINGHHWLLTGFARSFEAIPVTAVPDFQRILVNAQEIFAGLFVTAFQIAAPVLVVLFLTDFVLGLISRAVPQMNVFFVGVPLKIAVGLGAVIVVLPSFVTFFQGRVNDVITGATVLAQAAP